MENVELSKKLYGKYHSRTAYAYGSLAYYYLGREMLLPKGLLKDLYECSRIAFGEDHEFYKNIVEDFKNSPDPAKPTPSKISIDQMMNNLIWITEHLTISDKV